MEQCASRYQTQAGTRVGHDLLDQAADFRSDLGAVLHASSLSTWASSESGGTSRLSVDRASWMARNSPSASQGPSSITLSTSRPCINSSKNAWRGMESRALNATDAERTRPGSRRKHSVKR